MNIQNDSEDIFVNNQEKVIITSCLSDVIVLKECKVVDIYDINCEFLFISGCSKCNILSSKIKDVFINESANISHHNLDGKINKYRVCSNTNAIKPFSFIF